MRGVLLQELDRTSLTNLEVQELRHKFYLLVLPRQLDLVTFEDGRLFLNLNHECVHALL